MRFLAADFGWERDWLVATNYAVGIVELLVVLTEPGRLEVCRGIRGCHAGEGGPLKLGCLARLHALERQAQHHRPDSRACGHELVGAMVRKSGENGRLSLTFQRTLELHRLREDIREAAGHFS